MTDRGNVEAAAMVAWSEQASQFEVRRVWAYGIDDFGF